VVLSKLGSSLASSLAGGAAGSSIRTALADTVERVTQRISQSLLPSRSLVPSSGVPGPLPPGYSSFAAAKTALGSPGPGNVFDHVVEQSQAKLTRSGFPVEDINSPFNMNPVSARTNQLKANYYSSKQPGLGGLTVRDWLDGQPWEDQYQFGMQVLADIRNGLIN
jgi:hypothetical protein